MTEASTLSERDLRQRGIVPPQRLAAARITIIGVGAIGRQVALQLAAMGALHLQLIDPDTVEPVNLAAQGFAADDIGRSKVEAVAESCHRLNPQTHTSPCHFRYRRSLNVGECLFCCVDRITTRRHIWDDVQADAAFFSDGRMSGEVIRILSACDERSRSHYPSTLFAGEEAYEGACTARSTIFAASIAAGLMIEQFTRYLRDIPVDPDVQLNLLSMELSVA